MNSCSLFENEEEICNIEYNQEKELHEPSGYTINKEITIIESFIKVKSKTDNKYYIIRKTVYDNSFVDLEEQKPLTEFRIYEYDEELEDLLRKEADSVLKDKKELGEELETKLSEHVINQNKREELTSIFDKVSKEVIKDESSYQIKRAERLDYFINKIELANEIFVNVPELADKIKEQIRKSIEIIFNDDKIIIEKFKAKEFLAESLRLIKILYKGEKSYTANYLMLNKICNSETEQELHDSINYTLYHSALRRYYEERAK